QLLALTSHHAFVRAPREPAERPDAGIAAAARVGEGLVVVISRHALGSLGPQYRPSTTRLLAADALVDTYGLLAAVARWTRGAAGAAARPAAVRHARLAGDVPRRRRLQHAHGRCLSRRGRLGARALVGARRRTTRLERCGEAARTHQRSVDAGIRLCRRAPPAGRLIARTPG